MKKGILIISIIFLVLPLIMAATDTNDVDDSFQINTRIDYKKPCFNNGTYCSAAATCNYTVFNPDNTILVDNLTGTNQVSFYNVSFVLNEIGIHKVNMTDADVQDYVADAVLDRLSNYADAEISREVYEDWGTGNVEIIQKK